MIKLKTSDKVNNLVIRQDKAVPDIQIYQISGRISGIR